MPISKSKISTLDLKRNRKYCRDCGVVQCQYRLAKDTLSCTPRAMTTMSLLILRPLLINFKQKQLPLEDARGQNCLACRCWEGFLTATFLCSCCCSTLPFNAVSSQIEHYTRRRTINRGVAGIVHTVVLYYTHHFHKSESGQCVACV